MNRVTEQMRAAKGLGRVASSDPSPYTHWYQVRAVVTEMLRGAKGLGCIASSDPSPYAHLLWLKRVRALAYSLETRPDAPGSNGKAPGSGYYPPIANGENRDRCIVCDVRHHHVFTP